LLASCVTLQTCNSGFSCLQTPLWKEAKLQTYFTAHGRIDYFIVVEDDEEKGILGADMGLALILPQPEKELFLKLEKDYEAVKVDIEK
jgi:hypothetical protein